MNYVRVPWLIPPYLPWLKNGLLDTDNIKNRTFLMKNGN